jgi:signal transduction histidine kinase
MRNTISTLLNLSQLESGRISLDLTNIDLSSLVNEVIRDARTQANGHEFVVSVPSDLRAVRGDRAKMVEVLQNLIDNAVKYSPDGGGVTVSATSAGAGQVSVHVSDQGVGIREEDLGSLFSPYERASAQANGFSNGTGLGLYIVRSLVEIQGGKVWAESKIGTGSTFSFTIPDAASPQETGGSGRGEEREVGSQVPRDSSRQPVPAAPIVAERPDTV